MTGLVGFEDWARLAGDSPTSRTEWAALVAAWSEPHRRYHDLAHLAAVLGVVDALVGAAPLGPALSALLAVGHTSGADTAAGVLGAGAALAGAALDLRAADVAVPAALPLGAPVLGAGTS